MSSKPPNLPLDLSSCTKPPVMSVMNVGGVQVKWKSLDLLEQPAAKENSHEKSIERNVPKDLENCATISEKNCANSPKQEVQKVKERTRKIK